MRGWGNEHEVFDFPCCEISGNRLKMDRMNPFKMSHSRSEKLLKSRHKNCRNSDESIIMTVQSDISPFPTGFCFIYDVTLNGSIMSSPPPPPPPTHTHLGAHHLNASVCVLRAHPAKNE